MPLFHKFDHHLLTSAVQNSVNFALVKQLWMFRLNAFQFDRHLLAGGHVRPEVNVAEGPGADLAPQAVFLAHAQLHCCSLY